MLDISKYRYAVYCGSERLGMTGKVEPMVLCQTRLQAEHMAQFWGAYGYYREIPEESIGDNR